MPTEQLTAVVVNSVQGTGPYLIADPYLDAAEIRVLIRATTDAPFVDLEPTEYTVVPEASETQGFVTLGSAAAATYADGQMIVLRATAALQGYVGTSGPRDVGLQRQLEFGFVVYFEQDFQTQRTTILNLIFCFGV